MPRQKVKDIPLASGSDPLIDVELVSLVLHSIPHHKHSEVLTEHANGCTCKRKEVMKACERLVDQIKGKGSAKP